jgi:hypothetical protein
MISLAESEVTKRLGSFAALFAVPTMIGGYLRHELPPHSGTGLGLWLSGVHRRDAPRGHLPLLAVPQGRMAMMVIIEASMPLESGWMTENDSTGAAATVDGHVSIAASRGGASGDSGTFF